MRIQHNIPAMGAYRNYVNNTNAVSKNLEKLSSGYKINRAGDDAAGLAISEKMRAQITGLETAQKNAKDGISLVKTAEGALQEVHDMLNRMVTLSTQSANGTYDNETDRLQLQKEVDQLKTEINRIADSSNFNGIKLLDGSMDADGRRVNVETVFSGEKISNNIKGTVWTDGANKGFGGSNTKGGLELTGEDMATKDATTNLGAVDKSDISVRYHQDAKGSGKTTFSVELENVSFEADPGDKIENLVFGLASGKPLASGAVTDSGTASLASNVLTLDKNGTKLVKYDVTADNDGISGSKIAQAIYDKIKKDGDGKVFINPTGVAGKAIEYSVTLDGNKLNFEMTKDGYDTAVAETNKELDATTPNYDNNYFQGNLTFALNYKDAATLKTNGTAANATDAAKLEYAFTSAVHKQQNTATCDIKEGSVSSGTIYAQALIRFDEGSTAGNGYNKTSTYIADGKGFKFGDDYYIFAASDEVYNQAYADNVHVVDIRDLQNLNTTKLTAGDASNKYGPAGTGKTKDDAKTEQDLRTALDRLSVVAKDNKMFDVQVGRVDGTKRYYLVLNERSSYTGDANLTEKDYGLENQITSFDSATSKTEVLKEAGKSLSLQIGDTAEDFNQMKVNIKDIHTDSLGIKDIDISTQEGAAAAIGAIKNAINYVSDVRGTLGATQNRLEHTINNLSVMTENIQDAESTIRDTDIADEMMKYTKNNILVQSAQAMLAQANQIPQGVLQLLG